MSLHDFPDHARPALILSSFAAILDRRLRPDARAPLAVGFSGGGDSLALLVLTLDWARAHGRSVLALTVDHGLNPDSAVWTREALAKARALGADARTLAWTGSKPATGLSAAARAARHALLADAARQAGARVLLLGHTADDLAEAALMRAEGSTTPDPREWSPSPAWPQGRGVFLLRPLLGARRTELRAWLAARGHAWLDDPANDDPRSARARARRRLQGSPGGKARGAAGPDGAGRSELPPDGVRSLGQGWLGLPRDIAPAHLAAACLCAAGTTRPPRGERLERLAERLAGGETFVATLAGARIEAGAETIGVFREPGRAASGRALGDAWPLTVGATAVWDGRFELTALSPGLSVRALGGLAARLPPAQRAALKAVPAAARGALPALLGADGVPVCPVLATTPIARTRCLVLDRFAAAVGLVDQEPAT
ncbi:MAG: tRNA lysidine(34) synthetase TilS [Caulobacter sp.]|nr:tRNA lysidine(34) synthetase TilS [Caulobacter sp.]